LKESKVVVVIKAICVQCVYAIRIVIAEKSKKEKVFLKDFFFETAWPGDTPIIRSAWYRTIPTRP
jgi:hypothetical protein